MMNNTPIVSVQNVVRKFHVGGEDVYAVNGITFEARRGQLIAVRGRSGSGKTTLLNIIGGLDRPNSGTVHFDGQDLCKMSDRRLTKLRRHHIGFIFQSFGLIPILTAFENVELPMRLAGARRRERNERAMHYLETVGLAKRAGHRLYELSGGEQQRVGIARALVNKPDLILADEPTGELDSVTGWNVLNLFRDIVTIENICMIISTHDPTVDELAHGVHELSDGKIVNSYFPEQSLFGRRQD